MNDDENKFFAEKPQEADMERLSRAVQEVQKQPEFQHAPPKEVIKQSLRSISSSTSQATDDQATDDASTSKDDTAKDDTALLPDYMQRENKISQKELAGLVQMSITNGFEAGINEARKHGGFMIDALHDALAEKVYPELQKRGILP